MIFWATVIIALAGGKDLAKRSTGRSGAEFLVKVPKHFDFPVCREHLKNGSRRTARLAKQFMDKDEKKLIGLIREKQEFIRTASEFARNCHQSSFNKENMTACSDLRQGYFTVLKEYLTYQEAADRAVRFTQKMRRYIKSDKYPQKFAKIFSRLPSKSRELLRFYKAVYMTSHLPEGWNKCTTKRKLADVPHILPIEFDVDKKSSFCLKVKTEYSIHKNRWVSWLSHKRIGLEEIEDKIVGRGRPGVNNATFDLLRNKRFLASLKKFDHKVLARGCEIGGDNDKRCVIRQTECRETFWCERIFSGALKRQEDIENDMNVEYVTSQRSGGIGSPYESIGIANHHILSSFEKSNDKGQLFRQCVHAQNQLNIWKNYRGWKHFGIPLAVAIVAGLPLAPALAGAGFAAIFSAEAFLIGGASIAASAYMWREESILRSVDHNLGYRSNALEKMDISNKNDEIAAAGAATIVAAIAVARLTLMGRIISHGVAAIPR